MRQRHYLVVPAWSDQAGQMRVVTCVTATPRGGEDVRFNALAIYRRNPGFWREAGLVNSAGKLVCLDAPPEVHQQFRECEPIMGGLTITIEKDNG